MKKFVKKYSGNTIAALLLITAFPTFANYNCDCSPFNWTPYIGFMAEMRHMRWPNNIDGHGKLFKNNYPQANIFGGLKIIDYLGIEAGYKESATKSKQLVTINAGDRIFDLAPLNPPEQWMTKTQFRGWHAELVGFLPFCIKQFPFELLGSIGAIRLNTFHRATQISDSIGPFDILTTNRNFKKERSIMTLGLGLQYLVGDCYGFRFKTDWEHTAHLHRQFPKEINTGLSLRFKDTYNYGFGAFFFF